MKKLVILLFFYLPFLSMAQSVGINNDGSQPEGSAILDIKSTSKGLLIPRMTTIERTSIAGPAIGLMVFDINTFSHWMYRGDINGGWAELQHQYQNYWTANGNNINSNNSGNVGIGTSNPGEKLALNAANAAIQFMNSGTARGFLQVNGTDMRLGTYANNSTGKIVFATKAVDRMWVDENGQVGIGTADPVSALTINGTNPYIELQNGGVNKGFLLANGNDLKIGTNSTNTTGNLVLQTKLLDRVTIDENGQVGIGTTSPTSILSINASNPILQLKNSGVDKGFVQVVNDDIKIGTNIGNETGKFVIRTDGTDRFTLNSDGNATLGGTGGGGLLTTEGVFPGIVMKTSGITRLSVVAPGGNPEITGSGTGILRIRNNSDGIYMYGNGKISIGGGGAVATGYVVSVEGKLIATEVTSLPFGSWPDYVFADNYNLRPLSEVKKFIELNKHLPNIPSACEIEKNGIQLGDMSKRLMEKVEELTLYILQLQEQVDELKKELPAKKEK
jgi:hypothetical protein